MVSPEQKVIFGFCVVSFFVHIELAVCVYGPDVLFGCMQYGSAAPSPVPYS